MRERDLRTRGKTAVIGMHRPILTNSRRVVAERVRRGMSSKAKVRVGVLCEKTSPARSAAPPATDGAKLLFASSSEEFKSVIQAEGGQLDALLIVPPASPSHVDSVWEELELGKSVKWVHCFFAGVDSLSGFIDTRLGDIDLTNGRGAFSSSLAEYCMMAALHFNKQVPRCQKNRKDKMWERFTMNTLAGKKMGFVGFGDIATSTASLARAFGMQIGVFRRNPGKPSQGVDYVYTDKKSLLQESDFVVSTLPGTPATKHFFSLEEFRSMKPGAVFISCGRGSVVDEAALYKVLAEENQDLKVAMDVFEKEPLPAESPLWQIDDEKLLLTAHNADLTEDYFALGWDVFLKNLEAFQSGRPFLTPVNKKEGY